MRDARLYTDGDGFPIMQITLDALEMTRIAYLMKKGGIEQTRMMCDKHDLYKGDRLPGILAEINHEAGQWQALADILEEPYWARVDKELIAPFRPYPPDYDEDHEAIEDGDADVLSIVRDNEEGTDGPQ